MPKISVIIPAFNEARTIQEVVRKVQNTPIEKEVLIVDDGSVDGTGEAIRALSGKNIKKFFHGTNLGKGAAIATAWPHAEGDVIIIQDADLEYDPAEYSRLLAPILEGRADVVFGSRFLGEHRCLLFAHYIANKILNLFANVIYDTMLTDMMTGAKAFRRERLGALNLRAKRFGFEGEITGEVFKRGLRVFEVPVSYNCRTYQEGKKITWVSFFDVLSWLVKTRFRPREPGFKAQQLLGRMKRYPAYLFRKIEAFVKPPTLEIGCGHGNMLSFFLMKGPVEVVDISDENLEIIKRRFPGHAGLKVRKEDIENGLRPGIFEGQPKTIVCMNVLEHIADDTQALKNIAAGMTEGSVCILFVPAHKKWMSPIDAGLGHLRRYDKEDVRALVCASGLVLSKIESVNSLLGAGWWFNFCLLRQENFSAFPLWLADALVPLFGVFDRLLPSLGLNVLAVCRKPEKNETP
jgi:glycosyltransferase involved in cell wall biosynthesis